MAKVKGKEHLCTTKKYRKHFKSFQGMEGLIIFDRYNAIENVVNNYIDENYRHFLAQPIDDGNDTIDWFSIPFNQKPLQLSDLYGEEREKYERLKNSTINHFNSVIENLNHDNKKNEAELLKRAIKYVDDRCVFCFKNKVVLGIWGMQLRDEVKSSDGITTISYSTESIQKLEPVEPEPMETENNQYIIRFISGDGGSLIGSSEVVKLDNETISLAEIPGVEAKEGLEFLGWDKDPKDFRINGDTVFTAQYRETKLYIPPLIPLPLPWYKRFWNWLRAFIFSKGCLKWLLLLLLLLLLFLLLRRCSNDKDHVRPIPDPIETKPWIGEDPRVGGGGIYNPGDPYTPSPTPPEYSDVLPPNQGVLPPNDNPEFIREPGMPVIIANQLNILMENEDKSIMDFARDFKSKYPDDKYKIIYYDNVVKRVQIEIPPEERVKLKQEIPGKFTPEYELFVFDESLFEGHYKPNDPAYNDSNKSWYLKTIKAEEAWDITRGSDKLTIAIVDNGFNLSHPELKSKVVMPYNVLKHSSETFPQKADHGTHVAGTALAIIDNQIGLCGIAPNCSFMPVQVADKNGLMTTTSILDGILYALYQGADVVNVSLGVDFTGLDEFSEEFQKNLLRNHFKEEERLWNKVSDIAEKHQSVIVVAAGNDNILTGIDAIQRPDNIITVSAVDKDNQLYAKADFSNYGEYSTVSAPGVDIFSTVGKNNYEVNSGTSMAAPIVTGAVALMKSVNKDLTTKEIIDILQRTGLPVHGKIGNLIQLDKALQEASGIESPPPVPTEFGDVKILLKWNNYNDLDLSCKDPNGDVVWWDNKKVSSGGQLEIDMNAKKETLSRTPQEHIFWPVGEAPDGTYHVYLTYYANHDSNIEETPYVVDFTYGDNVKTIEGVIKEENTEKRILVYSFTLGN